MRTTRETDSSGTAIASEIRAAQAHSVLQSLTLSLWANSFIALTTAAILWLHQPSRLLVYWLAAVVLLNIARVAIAATIKRHDAAVRHTQLTLRVLTIAALISGCLWALAPLLGLLVGGQAHAYVIFITAGICAGAIIQSTAYSKVPIAFGAPQMLSAIATLLMTGTPMGLVVSLDVLLLMVMMFRSSRTSEASFIASHGDRLHAVSLAASLSQANAEICSSNRQLEVLASRDPLTGLGNRAAFNLGLSRLLEQNQQDDVPAALMIIDLDQFKSINDTLGHSAGDAVLAEVAHRLKQVITPSDLVVRLGGDEFAVIVDGPAAMERAHAAAAQFMSAVSEPIVIGDRRVETGASVGLAFFPHHAHSPDDLFACADIALYAAKDQGRRRVCVFNPAIKHRLDRQRQLEMDVSHAITGGDIKVYFQPQVRLSNGALTGFEALIRWTHPELGVVAPPEIVRAARAVHQSEALTRHVATASAHLIRRFPSLGLDHLCVAINVSPGEFYAYSLSRALQDVVNQTGIQPSQLEIEITEEAMLDTAAAGAELARLEQAGFRLAVDDFGMGHSSLAYLMSLRVDRLKIDRSFVRGIAASRQNQALVSALVGMGHALTIDIVVEGVESEEDAEILRMLGCRFGQGYLYGHPMPVEALEDWIQERNGLTIVQAMSA